MSTVARGLKRQFVNICQGAQEAICQHNPGGFRGNLSAFTRELLEPSVSICQGESSQQSRTQHLLLLFPSFGEGGRRAINQANNPIAIRTREIVYQRIYVRKLKQKLESGCTDSFEYQFCSSLAASKSASTLRLFRLQSQMLNLAGEPDVIRTGCQKKAQSSIKLVL